MTIQRQMIALTALVRREVQRILRLWPQTILPSAVTITLYYLIFGSFIGSQINDIDGYSYIQFIVPGLVMMAIITNSYSNVVSSFFLSKFQRSIEEYLSSPMPEYILMAGYALGGIFRGLTVGIVVTLVSLFFQPLIMHNVFIVFAFAILTSLVFSLGGLVNGIFAKNFDDISIVPTFVLQPLIYLGGVFYSIEALPPIWQNISKLNPIVYMVNGFRYGFLGVSDFSVTFALSMLTLFLIALALFNWYLLRRGVGIKD